MTDTVQKIISGVDEKTTDHFNAISSLVNLIDASYAWQFTDEDTKQLEVFVGRIISDLETRRIDTFTAIHTLTEARAGRSGIA